MLRVDNVNNWIIKYFYVENSLIYTITMVTNYLQGFLCEFCCVTPSMQS